MTVIAYQFPHGWFWKNKLRNVIAAGAPSQVCIKMSHILNEWSGVATGRVEVATAECTTVRTWHAPADGDGPAGWTFPPAAQQQPPPKLSILLPSPSKKTDSPPFDLSPPRHPYHSFGLAPWWSSLSLYPPSPEREREIRKWHSWPRTVRPFVHSRLDGGCLSVLFLILVFRLQTGRAMWWHDIIASPATLGRVPALFHVFSLIIIMSPWH